jgi:hypothetical protein
MKVIPIISKEGRRERCAKVILVIFLDYKFTNTVCDCKENNKF